jgi:hypothetical protein
MEDHLKFLEMEDDLKTIVKKINATWKTEN